MKVTTVSVTVTRKYNLGNYEMVELSATMFAKLNDDDEYEPEDPSNNLAILFIQAKNEVKNAHRDLLQDMEQDRLAKLNQQKQQARRINQEGEF
jgi:hypothetical protein